MNQETIKDKVKLGRESKIQNVTATANRLLSDCGQT